MPRCRKLKAPTYLRVRNGPIARTRWLSDAVTVDLDDKGRLLGIELLVDVEVER